MIKKLSIEEGKNEGEWLAYFDIMGSELYNVRIPIKEKIAYIHPVHCDCVWGSFYGLSKKNREKGIICRHIKESIELLKFLKYIEKFEEIE